MCWTIKGSALYTLQVTVEFHEDETLSSFVSRLAAANSAPSAKVFCQHMGLRFQSLVDGDQSQVEKLLFLSRQQHKVGSAGVGCRDERTFQFGRETLLRSTLTRSRLRVCAHCLDRDETIGHGPSGTRAYGRLTWLPSFVRTCAEHSIFLTPLPDPIGFGSPHDFAARVSSARAGWSDFRQQCLPAKPSEFELYVRNRIVGSRQSSIWLDEFPLYVAGRLTEITGAILTHGRNFVTGNLTDRDWLEAGRAGFKFTSAGPDAFVEFLKTLHDRFWQGNADFGGRFIYGRLYEMLAHENEDPAYDQIRELIRETAVASLPIGPDHKLFGIASPRRWHSVHTAAKQFGLHHSTARKMFAAAKLFVLDDEIADGRLLMKATDVETFVRRWQFSFKTDAARERLNIGRSSWDIVMEQGYVTPLISNYRDHGVAPLFPIECLEAFVRKLETAAPVGRGVKADSVDLSTAVKRASTRLSLVLELLFQGRLPSACSLPDQKGFNAVRVSLAEILSALKAFPSYVPSP